MLDDKSIARARRKADALIAAAVVAEEQELADALVKIAQKYGKFNEDDTGIWAGYESAAENENASIGVSCANCILYAGGTSCKIIAAEVEPGGYCRFALIPDGIVSAKMKEQEATSVSISAAGSRRAPKKDRIHGSKKNKPGSAAGGKKIVFSAKTETALKNKVKEHNEKASAGRKATLSMLKAVYRRGAGAYSSSHRPGKTRDQWAMARVNAFLKLLKSGRPSNSNYRQDNDLLPSSHPKASKSRTASAMTASAIAASELDIELKEEDEYQSPEHALVAFAEYSGLGYEVIPALRAAWVRAVADDQDPFTRARELAVLTYESEDADLLPIFFPFAVTAGLPPGDLWRSVKAKLQRRDRKGRFAEMGGGFSFSINFGNGKVSRASGKIVGMSGEDDVDVEVEGHPDLPNGIYSVPASKGEAAKAVIKPEALKGVDRSKVEQSDIDNAIDVSELRQGTANDGGSGKPPADAPEAPAESPEPEPDKPKVPAQKKPRFPRKPPTFAFSGKAEEVFGGVDSWEEFSKVLADTDVVYIDYETTGLDFDDFGEPSSNGAPLQVGAVRMRNGVVVDRINIYMNPGVPMSGWTDWSRTNLVDSDNNPYTDEFFDDKPTIAEAHSTLSEFIGDSIVGMQNAVFDESVLTDALTEAGIDWRPSGIVDTKEVADMTLPRWSEDNPDAPFKMQDGQKVPSNSLGDITKYLEVDLGDKHHSADYDAQATGEVLEKIVEGAIEKGWTTDVLDKEKRDEKSDKNNAWFESEVAKFKEEKDKWLESNEPAEAPSATSVPEEPKSKPEKMEQNSASRDFDEMFNNNEEFRSFAEGMMRQGMNKSEVLKAWREKQVDIDLKAQEESNSPK